MGVINIKDLKEGMALAADIKDSRGRLLICRGAVLSGKYLKLCKMWGVVEADVEGVSSENIYASAVHEFDTASLAAAQGIVHQRFCHNDLDHPAITELVRLNTLWIASGKASYQDNEKGKPGGVDLHKKEFEQIAKNKPLNINRAEYIGCDTKLSTLPDIYRQIIEAISKPSSSAYDIEKVIRTDTNLSARVLKIVNSAFYSYPSRIDSLSHAVNIIGTKQLSTLAIGINIIGAFKNIPSEIVNMKMFWKHSVLCGICARLLAGYKNIQNTERMFVAGLLHDIGRLVLYNYLPIESLYAATTAKTGNLLLYAAERDVLSFDHAIIGADLLNKWQISVSLEECIRYHHEPQRSKNGIESSIIHLADIIANVMGMGSSGERLIPSLDNEAWMRLELTPNTLTATIEQAGQQLEEVFQLIYGYDKSN